MHKGLARELSSMYDCAGEGDRVAEQRWGVEGRGAAEGKRGKYRVVNMVLERARREGVMFGRVVGPC